MADPIGMGVVGAGAIGMRCALSHLSLADIQDRVRLAAVCDPAPGRAQAAAQKFGVPHWYLTLEELLADPSVDAVTIGSPIGLHYEQGIAAIRAGKHVHFNKTMATQVWECDEMIQLARQKGVRLVASPGMMAHPHNRRIREKVLGGAIGQVIWAAAGACINTYHLDEEYRTGDNVLTQVDPSWYFRRPGGGPLYDVTVYSLHSLTGILGPAKRVTAMSGLALPQREFRGKMIACDMDDNTFMLLDFGSATFGVVYGTVEGHVARGFHPSIFGMKGSVIGTELNGEQMRQESDHQPHVTGEHAKMAESHVYEDLMQLVDYVRDGTPPVASAEHARHVIDIFESAYRSAETGRTQELKTSFEHV
ncbi:MAG: Gfo/Idh/MocA family protein [Armatimonadota bacterium]